MKILFQTESGLYGFKDPDGEIVIAPIYDFALPFSEGMAVVCRGGKMGYGKTGFIGESGEIIIDFIYDGARSFSEGLAQVERVVNGVRTTGFIDKKGETVIPMIYNYAMSFHYGVAPVCIGESWVNGRFGCIDKNGRIVIPIEYSYLELIGQDRFIVKQNGKWGIIDRSENPVTPYFDSQKALQNYLSDHSS